MKYQVEAIFFNKSIEIYSFYQKQVDGIFYKKSSPPSLISEESFAGLLNKQGRLHEKRDSFISFALYHLLNLLLQKRLPS